MIKQRKLSKEFLEELLYGSLSPILEYVNNDDTLDLQIRKNYIIIYYRGGKILGVQPMKFPVLAKPKFDTKYISKANNISRAGIITWLGDPDWYNKCEMYFPLAKQAMDKYFSGIKRSEEREFQQLLVRTNNYSSIAKGTDYFIIDIEYAFGKSRFDIVAIEWQSTSSLRRLKKSYRPKLMIIEMKFGDKALKSTSGLIQHLNDMNNFIKNAIKKETFKNEMIELFKQKRKLGVIPDLAYNKNPNEVEEFADDIDIGLLLVDHDPASKQLINTLNNAGISNSYFLSANFMGYALYKENRFNFDDFNQRFNQQIG